MFSLLRVKTVLLITVSCIGIAIPWISLDPTLQPHLEEQVRINKRISLAYLHTKIFRRTHLPPLRDPILSFWYTISPKSTHVGGPHPRKTGPRPPTGNLGSAPESHTFVLAYICSTKKVIYNKILLHCTLSSKHVSIEKLSFIRDLFWTNRVQDKVVDICV